LQLRHLPTPDLSSIRLVIGPESGLSSQEVELCKTHGFTAISLGPRVLRTETATAATLAALQALFGDG
jgi:16S rRNA (uracil1498-N3)-methyltransferase